MTAALPRLNVQPIPGGLLPDPEGTIDQILDGVAEFPEGDLGEPPPSEFDRQPRERPRSEPTF